MTIKIIDETFSYKPLVIHVIDMEISDFKRFK